MHVLAIYRVNEHLADLMAEASAERQARESKPKGRRFALVTSLFAGRAAATPAAGPTKAFANS
ncbi:MAG TPA: hypothetical protein VFQ75_06800 [Candidatus Limnocylindrales bacterium]|jgi:hypothetical protein|nr:hypothetical protein [Candidatus Limnocylindrales bacterium]